MKRREFFTFVPIAALAWRWLGRLDFADHSQRLANTELIQILGADRVQRLGALYLRGHPTENNAEYLALLIARATGRNEPDIRKAVDTVVRSDFATGRTVVVDGWVLSVTEARQCALYALVTGRL